MGCYVAYDSPPLQVGVDGRRRFPSTGLVEPIPPFADRGANERCGPRLPGTSSASVVRLVVAVGTDMILVPPAWR